MNDECGLDFAKRITYKLTRGKQNTCLTRHSLDDTIATIDRWLKMTGCRIVECKQFHTNDKKSNNPLPHNTEKSVGLFYIGHCYLLQSFKLRVKINYRLYDNTQKQPIVIVCHKSPRVI